MDYSSRLNALVEQMRKRSLDLVLLFDRDNVRYFTGFHLNRVANSILAVSWDGMPTYVVAHLDVERAKRVCWIEHVIPFPEDTPNYLAVLTPLFRPTIRRIGVEKDSLTVRQAECLRELAGVGIELVDVRDITAELRVVKSQGEIACIRQAVDIADRVMKQILEEIRPGVVEAELVGKVEYFIRRAGAEGSPFEPFVMSGENAWLPQRVASRKPLQNGELVLLDMGAIYEGYCSDITRTFAVGEVSEEQRHIFQTVCKAQQAALEVIQPEVPVSEVDRAARQIIEAEGLGAYFPHITGHGVGVSTHEAPILDRQVDTLLRPGMVITVEPGVYLPGVGAARVEDMVLVTSTGYELLSNAPRDLV